MNPLIDMELQIAMGTIIFEFSSPVRARQMAARLAFACHTGQIRPFAEFLQILSLGWFVLWRSVLNFWRKQIPLPMLGAYL